MDFIWNQGTVSGPIYDVCGPEDDDFEDTDFFSSVSEKFLHLNMGYFDSEKGIFNAFDEMEREPIGPELHLRRVDVSEHPVPLYEIRAGPPYRIDVDAVPMQRQKILLEYPAMSRKSSRLMEFYTMDACAMLDNFSKMEGKLRILLRNDPSYAELNIDRLLKELEGVINGLESCSSKAHNNIKECFQIANWLNEFYEEDVPIRARARRMAIADRKFNKFRRCLEKVKDCTQAAVLRKKRYETLALTIFSILQNV